MTRALLLLVLVVLGISVGLLGLLWYYMAAAFSAGDDDD